MRDGYGEESKKSSREKEKNGGKIDNTFQARWKKKKTKQYDGERERKKKEMRNSTRMKTNKQKNVCKKKEQRGSASNNGQQRRVSGQHAGGEDHRWSERVVGCWGATV